MSQHNNAKRTLILNVLLLLIVVIVVFGLRFRQLGQDPALANINSVQAEQGIPVEAITAAQGDLERWITLAGTVEGHVQYPVQSSNALRVLQILVQEGDTVESGDVLMRLASRSPSPMYHSLGRSQADYDNKLLDVKRLRNLFTEGAVSRQDLDAAETRLKVAETELADAEGSTLLKASRSGIVAAILIRDDDTATPNEPLIWITRTDTVKVVFDAGSNQALAMAEGQRAVWSDPLGGVRTGQVTQLDLMANPKTHLLSGEMSFANTDGRLVPGLLISCRVRTAWRPDVVQIPRACLVGSADQPSVWVVVQTLDRPVAVRREIQTGLTTVDHVEVLQGLASGEQVIQHGQTLLTDNAPVVVRPGQEG